MIEKNKLYLFTTILMTAIFFVSLWTLDISVGAILTPNAKIIGLWGIVKNPILKYHQALYMTIISYFLAVLSVLMFRWR